VLVRGVVAVALVWGGPAFATSIEDCQRVIAQFQGEVASLGVTREGSADQRAALRTSIGAAAKSGKQADIAATLQQLDRFQKQASEMAQRGELTNFDAERMVQGAQAVGVCYERVRDGK
jgi:hypothetical protein